MILEVQRPRFGGGLLDQLAALLHVHRREARQPRIGLAPRGLTHPQRLENMRADIVGEGLARQLLDERGLHVDRDAIFKSEERRVGKEWVSTGRSRWLP